MITNSFRSEKATQLLIIYIRTHNLVSVDTVSRWPKKFLRLSGIETSIFTGHSTRTASASKAKKLGLSLPEISKRGQWTKKTIFETFYNNQLWIIQWKSCKVNNFFWVTLNIRYYIDWDLAELNFRTLWGRKAHEMKFRFHEQNCRKI